MAFLDAERDHFAALLELGDACLAMIARNGVAVSPVEGLEEAAFGSRGCGCHACLDDPSLGWLNPTNRLMIVCPTCGYKRCPRATHHDNPCTGSNEPGQEGSRY